MKLTDKTIQGIVDSLANDRRLYKINRSIEQISSASSLVSETDVKLLNSRFDSELSFQSLASLYSKPLSTIRLRVNKLLYKLAHFNEEDIELYNILKQMYTTQQAFRVHNALRRASIYTIQQLQEVTCVETHVRALSDATLKRIVDFANSLENEEVRCK